MDRLTTITRESTSCLLKDLISPEVFDSDIKERETSKKRYRIPSHQRFPSWKPKDKELLVDSIMRNYSIQALHVITKVDPQFHTVYYNVEDGQNRLCALQEYMLNKYTWSNLKYKDLPDDLRYRFDNYCVRVEKIHHNEQMTPDECDTMTSEMFSRSNKGRPLTDNDQYHSRKNTPTMMLLFKLKQDPEFEGHIKHYICSDLGGGLKRKGLKEMVALILTIALNDTLCITTSYRKNGVHVVELEITNEIENKVRVFLRWYFALLDEVFEHVKKTKQAYSKTSGVCGMILYDWVNGSAIQHRNMWIRYISMSHYHGTQFEKKLFLSVPRSEYSNDSVMLQTKINVIIDNYEKNNLVIMP